VIEVDHKKLVKEEYKCVCPYCSRISTLNATRPYDPKTLAMSINDDLDAAISEVDKEIKEKNDEI